MMRPNQDSSRFAVVSKSIAIVLLLTPSIHGIGPALAEPERTPQIAPLRSRESSQRSGTSPGNLPQEQRQLPPEVGNLSQLPEQVMGQVTGPLQTYLQQIQQFLNPQNLNSILERYLGNYLGQILGGVEQSIGALGLPDPEKLLDSLLGTARQEPRNTQAEGGINPIAWNRNGVEVAVLTGRAQVQRILDQKAQEAYKQELERLATLVQQSAQLNTATQQAIGTAAQAASRSSQITAKAQQQAQQASQRVSTQDTLKDLNQTAADMVSQLDTQAQVLVSVNRLQGTQVELQAAQLEAQVATATHSQQITLNTAVAARQMTDLNELAQGQERLRLLQEQAATAQLMEANQNGFRLMR